MTVDIMTKMTMFIRMMMMTKMMMIMIKMMMMTWEGVPVPGRLT